MFPGLLTPLALLFVLVGCGGTAPATSVPTAPGVTLPPLPTLPGQQPPASLVPDQPLEELFPDEVGGLTLDVRSATGASVRGLFGDDGDTAELDEFLAEIGTSIENVSAAFSFAFGPGATETEFVGISIGAIRVRNVPSGNVLQAFATATQREVPGGQIGTATVGGKSVTTLTDPEDADGTTYFYAVGDVVFFVAGSPASLVEEAFAKLP